MMQTIRTNITIQDRLHSVNGYISPSKNEEIQKSD
jgi:hypothetical protein